MSELNDWICPDCGKSFPRTYSVKTKRIKEYGTKQLMALWAYYNW